MRLFHTTSQLLHDGPPARDVAVGGNAAIDRLAGRAARVLETARTPLPGADTTNHGGARVAPSKQHGS